VRKTVLLLVLLLTAGAVYAENVSSLREELRKLELYQPYQDAARQGYEFVTPCPQVRFNACVKQCPQGWELVEDKSNWRGVYLIACKPPQGSLYPQLCYYINYKCYEEEEQKFEGVALTGAEGLEEYAAEGIVSGTPDVFASGKLGKVTFPELLVGIMTADPDMYRILVERSKDDRVGQAFWSFMLNCYTALLKITRALSTLFLLFMIGWFLGSYHYNVFVFRKFEDMARFPYHSLPTYFTRLALVAALFFFPLPDSKIDNQMVYQPLFVKLVRAAAEFGNRQASRAVKTLDDQFISFTMQAYGKTKLQGEYVERIRQFRQELERIKEKEAELIGNCYLVYDAHTFQLPDELLNQIRFDPKGEIEGTYWSRERCRAEEAKYLAMVAQYNKGVQQLKTELERELGELLSKGPSLWDRVTGQSARSALRFGHQFDTLEESLGWMAFPVVVVPSVRAVSVMNDELLATVSDSVGSGEFKDASAEKGKLRKKFARWATLVALPPGNWVFQGVMDMIEKATSVLSFVTKWNFVGKMALTAGLGAGGVAVAIAVAYMLLKMMAVIAVLVGFTFRYVAYLLEVLKVTFLAPFVAVWSATLKRHENALSFTGRVLYVMAYPLMMVISVFMAVLAVVVIELIVYKIPTAGIVFLQGSKFHLGAKFAVSGLLVYLLSAFFWYLSIIASVIVGFVVAFNGPEWIVEAFGRWEGHWQGVVHASRGIAEQVTRSFISPL